MKIAVLVSGGVDSSVALKLLKDQGHELTAFYLKIWLEDELSFLGNCPWEEDLSYVTKVCEQLEVPLEVISFQKEYWDQVVSYTVSEVKAGRTPNPDVLCNTRVKFGAFYSALNGRGFDKIATGHYAQVKAVDNEFELHTSPDLIKDQTYFLSHLSKEQISKALFPIGHLQKSELRQLAQEFDLPNKDRKDSQGICFLGKIKFKDFIQQYLGTKAGDMVEFETGKKLAEHEGFWFYTIGQRQGIGLSGGPWYVVSKDIDKNIVYISKNYHNLDKPRNQFTVGEFNWISGNKPELHNLTVKLRHGQEKYNCSIQEFNEEFGVTIDKNDQGIAAGQFAVFYKANICLGTGVIIK
ncbi:MAG: tRNA 2-thiouridine(34) synthase MnmA [Candidatus Babeliales bacterium]|nr:tRNA 2-thiouridine(34) synthase MnmA [Candidatus Babeliales bacterium]